MKIACTSVFVEDQDEALAFCTEVLGFVKEVDVPLGQYRCLTVVSPEAPGGTELVLEPREHPAAIAFTSALTALGVVFTQPATSMGPVTTAVFEDTVGNLLQIQSCNA